MSKALLVIDAQNDYFPDGAFPLWNTDATLSNIAAEIARAKYGGVVPVQGRPHDIVWELQPMSLQYDFIGDEGVELIGNVPIENGV